MQGVARRGATPTSNETDKPSWLLAGPRVPPGSYSVRLTVGDVIKETTVDVVRDQRTYADDEDLAAQYAYLVLVRDLVEQIERAVEHSKSVRAALTAWTLPTVPSSIRDDAGGLADALERVERILSNPEILTHGDELKLAAGLDKKLVLLPEIVVELSDTRPTSGAEDVLDLLAGQAQNAIRELDRLMTERLPAFERRLRDAGDVSLIKR